MNSGFEDCLVFREQLQQPGATLSSAVTAYARVRSPDGHAIATLSYQNYEELRSHTASVWYPLRKRMDACLHAWFPRVWSSVYALVFFSRTPYSAILRTANRQKRMLTAMGWALGAGLVACGTALAVLASRSSLWTRNAHLT